MIEARTPVNMPNISEKKLHEFLMKNDPFGIFCEHGNERSFCIVCTVKKGERKEKL